ncbi:Crp/Fnr family transcriptional regulator [Nocardioides sp. WS12]|uniref:Crp/Fnr family transcriptional regulator n=1 Tax=Nocardioides sp. WS12 TaxID=2486272 RepID=UPI0015F9A79A|nr:Crp/Fnr family transcriptional regulator [Nocardioides sp. WS12]
MEWPLLGALDEREWIAVLAAAKRRSFAKGDIVFSEGDLADSVQLVASGHLAVQVSTPDGDLATLSVLGPGAWFGELSLMPGQIPTPRSANVFALDPAETLVLTRSAFHILCEEHPRIERLVIALMAARIRELGTDLLEARYVGLDRRVCATLDRLANIYVADGTRTEIPVTQTQLADLVGCVRPRLNEILQRLVTDRVVELGRGKLTIVDRPRLLHRDDP